MNPHLPSSTNTTATTASASTWKEDLLASLVVFLVALPLCMGIALASGAPIAAGLITGILGGLLVGTVAGSPLQVSGPAAGLTVICGEIIRQNGMQVFGMAVLIAGVIQLVAGLLRLGQWFRAVSPAVIHGMLSGIGVLILCSQLHVLVDERPRENAPKNIVALPQSLQKGIQWPSHEPADVRTSRIELLRISNGLGTRQRTQRSAVDRALLRIGSLPTGPVTSDGAADAPVVNMASVLQPFVAEQDRLLSDMRTLSEKATQSPLVTADDPDGLRPLLATALTAVADAQTAMTAPDSKQLQDTQAAAATAVDALTAKLKRPEWAGKVGLLAVCVIFAWQYVARGKLKLIPAPLLAIVIATAVAQVFRVPVLYVDVPANLLDGVTWPSLAVFSETPVKAMLVPGIVLAIVASAETLLCATAVDQMHTGPRTKYDRELQAQGLGNITCGFLGVLPMTGVIVRSAANVQAGGKSRMSAILHGVWLLLFSVALTPVLRMIPTAALAGILVYTGFRLMDIKGLIHLWKENKVEAMIFLATVVVIVMKDLLSGVIVGLILSAAKLLWRFSRLEIATVSNEAAGASGQTIVLTGAATFIRLPLLAAALDKVPAGGDIVVNVTEVDYIDRACMDLLQNWSRQHAATGGNLTIDWDHLGTRFQKDRPRTNAAAGR